MEKYYISLSLVQSWMCKISSRNNMYYEDRISLFFITLKYYYEIVLASLFSCRVGFASAILHLSTEGFLQLTLNSGAERRITPFAPIFVHPLDFSYRFIFFFLHVLCNHMYYEDRLLFFIFYYFEILLWRSMISLFFSYIELDV